MPPFRPWMARYQIDARERCRWQPFEQKHGVVEVQPDIGEIFQLDRRERLGHSVDERLDPDEAGARMLLGLLDHVLAAAESDLEADAVDRVGEQQREVGRRGPGKLDGKPWQ